MGRHHARGGGRASPSPSLPWIDYLVVVRGGDLLGGRHPARRPRRARASTSTWCAGIRAAVAGARPGVRPGLDRRRRPGRVGHRRRALRRRGDDPGPDRRPRARWPRCAAGRAGPDPALHAVQPDLQGAGQPQPHRQLRGRAPRRPRARRTRRLPSGAAPAPPSRRCSGRRRRHRPGSSAPGSPRPRGHRVTVRRAVDRAGRHGPGRGAGAGRERLALAADWLEPECGASASIFETRRDGRRRATVADADDRWCVVLACGGVAGGAAPTRSTPTAARSTPPGPGRRARPATSRRAARRARRRLGPHRRADRGVGGRAARRPGPRRRADHARPHRRHAAGPLGRSARRPTSASPGRGRAAHKRAVLAPGRGRPAPWSRTASPASRTVVSRRGGRRRPPPARRRPARRASRPSGVRLRPAGDAVAPRTIYEAVLEGRRAALADCEAAGRGSRMSGSQYRYLFSPLQLGPVTVPNRIVFSAHLTNYAEGGMPTEQHAAYYAARAAGGAGLIITEEHSVHPTDWPYEKMIHAFHPEVRARLPAHHRGRPRATARRSSPRSTTTAARRRACTPGCRCGRRRRCPTRCSARCPRPSTRPRSPRSWPATPTWPRRCREGGFDGIELQCSHSSIVRGFLSPATNHRTDAYGGQPREPGPACCTRSSTPVREAIGRDLALGVRLCGDELIDGGITIDETVEVARPVEASGLVDYINTSIGVATATLFMIEASMHIPPELRAVHPLRAAQGRRPAGGRRRAGSRTRCRPSGRWPRATATSSAWCGARSPTPTSSAKARAGPAPRHPAVPVVQPGVRGPHGPQPLARLHREPPHRPGGDHVRCRPLSRRGPAGCWSSAPGRPGCRRRSSAAQARPRGRPCWSATTSPAARSAGRPPCPTGPSSATSCATCCTSAGGSGVEIRYGARGHRRRGAGRSAPDAVVVATGSPPGPALVGAARPTTSRRRRRHSTCSPARARPAGEVVVIDEVGFHQATSRGRAAGRPGLPGRGADPGHGRRPGPRHHPRHRDTGGYRATAKGIVQTTDSVIVGLDDGGLHGAAPPDRRDRAADRRLGACSPCRQPAEDGLYRELGRVAVGVELHRVGDCVAPRRAHAAVSRATGGDRRRSGARAGAA